MFALVQDTVNGVSVSKVDALDFADLGRLTLPLDSDANVNPRAFVERVGFELDVEGADLRAYKQVRAFMPLVSVADPSASLNFLGGKHDEADAAVIYPAVAVSYNPPTRYKIDTTLSGRYLAFRMTMTAVKDFSFSGMDVDVIITGRR
jgi:hypothetical protein